MKPNSITINEVLPHNIRQFQQKSAASAADGFMLTPTDWDGDIRHDRSMQPVANDSIFKTSGL